MIAVLAAHVVGAREDVPERWPAQHEAASVRGLHEVREVGVAAGDDVEAERGDRAGDVLDEPRRDVPGVDPGDVLLGDHPPDGTKGVPILPPAARPERAPRGTR